MVHAFNREAYNQAIEAAKQKTIAKMCIMIIELKCGIPGTVGERISSELKEMIERELL